MSDSVISVARVNAFADVIMAAIREDMSTPAPNAYYKGFHVGDGTTVPAGLAHFRQLHDYVDANMYLIDAGVPFGADSGAGREGCEACNLVCDEISRRMAAESYALTGVPSCVKCGDFVYAQCDSARVPVPVPLTDRVWSDSSGDPVCWVDKAAHVPYVAA